LDELGGSEYIKVAHGLVAGRPPALDLDLEADVQGAVREAVRSGLLNSAHDCSEGGLAIALAECCAGNGVGATVTLDDDLPPVASLFSESQSRILVSVAAEKTERLLDVLAAHDVPWSVIGETCGDSLVIADKIDLPVARLKAIYETALEAQVRG
jgi:phosphoribosylformylglycinamidine synthase